jgi:hypothetical protein
MGSRLGALALAGTMAVAVLSAAPPVAANEDDVIRRGQCGGRSNWKLKLSPENGRIEVEFEVDQNRVGRRWRIVLTRDGNRFFRGARRTTGPSGSFELRRVVNNGPGRDRVVARARALRSGERCRGVAVFRR